MTDQTNTPSYIGLHHFPLRIREARHSDGFFQKIPTINAVNGTRKRLPESLHFEPGTFRLRSPTESSISSVSSANPPDSATTRSLSSLASPISTCYASEVQEQFAAASLEDAEGRFKGHICHRHVPSNGTCSTFVNDEDDGTILTGYPNLELKIHNLENNHPTPITEEPQPPILADIHLKEEPGSSPTESHVSDQHGDDAAQEDASTTTDTVSPEDAASVLSCTLQLLYGLDLNEISLSTETAQDLVANFVQDIDNHIWKAPSDGQLSHTTSTASSWSTPSQEASGGDRRGGKRKKQGRRDDDGDEFSDGDGHGGLPTKRARPSPKEEENLRLSCPFRKRNPHRFNVRDHHSCAMTYFPKFAELRQHIVKQHKRDDPSAYVCDRCSRDFSTRKDLRDHQRLPKELMCDIADHDAESGIDPSTATKLLSRKRASGTSPEVQWKEIWNILFPDDDDRQIQSHDFTPVIEHFELAANYQFAFEQLKYSLLDKISNPATLETLSTKFYQCFIETIEQCVSAAQTMPYMNRSNKKNDFLRSQGQPTNQPAPIQRKVREMVPRPDSGVVMDDGSEESGSVMLGHKDSVRTMLGARRPSSQIPETVREICPPNLGFENMMQANPASMGVSPMGTADVQAWNHNVMYAQPDDMALSGQFIQSNRTPPQPDFVDWAAIYPAGLDGIGMHDLTGNDNDRTWSFNQQQGV